MSAFTKKELLISYGGASIFGELYLPEAPQAEKKMVIFSHGIYSSYMATGESAAKLAERGYHCYCFDYKGCSYSNRSGGDILEASILTEKDELNAVVDYFVKEGYDIYLAGQSLGCIIASLVADERAGDINAMLLMYPAFNLTDYIKSTFPSADAVPEKVENFLGVPGLNLGKRFFVDAMGCNAGSWNYDKPVLILHGDNDKLVPLQYGELAHNAFRNSVYIVVPGGEHGFALNEETAAVVDDFYQKREG